MPQPVSASYAVSYPETYLKGTPEEYTDVETVICKEAAIWLEYLPGPNKWVQIPTQITDTPYGPAFRIADMQASLQNTFQALRGKYLKVYKATYDDIDPDALRPKVDCNTARNCHNKDAIKPLTGGDKMSIGFYYLVETAEYPELFEYKLHCAAKNMKYALTIPSTELKIHTLKRYYLFYSYDL